MIQSKKYPNDYESNSIMTDLVYGNKMGFSKNQDNLYLFWH